MSSTGGRSARAASAGDAEGRVSGNAGQQAAMGTDPAP